MYYIFAIILLILIVLIESWSGLKLDFSAWQLKEKRKIKSSEIDKLDLKRLKFRSSLLTIQILILILLYILLFVVVEKINLMHVSLIYLLMIFVFIITNLIAKLSFLQKKIDYYFKQYELKIYYYLEKVSKLKIINLSSFTNSSHLSVRDNIESLDELNFLLENSPSVISDNDQKLISSGLNFHNLKVKDIYTKIDEVYTVEPDDLLNPIRLDELHKTGHSHFPVVTGKDHVVGIIDLYQLFNLEIKDTLTAREIMRKEISKVNLGDSLEDVLNQLIREKLFIAVIETNDKIIGIISLKDIINKLRGY